MGTRCACDSLLAATGRPDIDAQKPGLATSETRAANGEARAANAEPRVSGAVAQAAFLKLMIEKLIGQAG